MFFRLHTTVNANSNTSYNTYIDYDTDNTDIAYRCASAIQLQ